MHHLNGLSHARMIKLQQEALRRFYLRPRKLLEHLRDLRSMGRIISFLRGGFFVLSQLWNSRQRVPAATWVADGLLPEG